MSDIFEFSLEEPPKKEKKFATSSTHEEPLKNTVSVPRSPQRSSYANNECLSYSSLCCSTK